MSTVPVVANCLTEVIYMSSFGPGSSRHVSIPSHGLRISDSGAIEAWNGRYICGQIVQLRELETSEVAELDRLNAAREEFERAKATYESAKAAFMTSATGLKLGEYLHPPWAPAGPPDTTDLTTEFASFGASGTAYVKKATYGMDLYKVIVTCSDTPSDEANKALSAPLVGGKYRFRCKRDNAYYYECGTEYEAYRETDLELLKCEEKYDGPLLAAFEAQRAALKGTDSVDED